MDSKVERKILPELKEFKTFWKKDGPFRFALTSREYPPVLLEPEEWLFSNDVGSLLKDLMGYDQKKMAVVHTPFNPKKKKVLRPDDLSEWKINNFPEEWQVSASSLFVPPGHLTRVVLSGLDKDEPADIPSIEKAFFRCLETEIDALGYILFKPRNGSKWASLSKYLAEWEKDESEAGLL